MSAADSEVRLHPFTRAVAGALRRRCGVRQADTSLTLGVSGGADSVALLRALAAVAPARGWRLRLVVAHVDHRARPGSADDAAFVADLAQRLNLPFELRALDPAGWRGNRESAMRAARYAALRDVAESRDSTAVVTAHHADDQLETVLMRLLRGASVTGLAGMRWRRRLAPGAALTLLRPMLAVTRDAGRDFLHDIGQPWREDATNTDISRTRARLRRDVLPVLHALRPRAGLKAVALGDHLAALDRHLLRAGQALQAQAEVRGDVLVLPRRAAAEAEPVVLMRLLRCLLQEAGAPADALGLAVLRGVVRAVRDGGGGRRTFAVAAGVRVTVTRESISISRVS